MRALAGALLVGALVLSGAARADGFVQAGTETRFSNSVAERGVRLAPRATLRGGWRLPAGVAGLRPGFSLGGTIGLAQEGTAALTLTRPGIDVEARFQLGRRFGISRIAFFPSLYVGALGAADLLVRQPAGGALSTMLFYDVGISAGGGVLWRIDNIGIEVSTGAQWQTRQTQWRAGASLSWWFGA